ncbi:MAG: Ppx/GppA phosphatase family protein [Solirubrobacteraceae bacterium]
MPDRLRCERDDHGRLLALGSSAMRVAVVDIGTNSTRLLVAEVDPETGTLEEVARRSTVTRLGEGVDANGRLSDEAVARTIAIVEEYAGIVEDERCEANLAVLTSATRDAADGAEFSERVRALGLDAKVLTGDEEAQLMFLGAMSGRRSIAAAAEDAEAAEAVGTAVAKDAEAAEIAGTAAATVVIDIGGGSTEFVLGSGREASFHVSMQAGVVRMSERHIHSDPPESGELDALARDVRELFEWGLPDEVRSTAREAIAVAGTATSAAAIDQALDPYDPEKVNGYRVTLATVEQLLARLSSMDEGARRRVVGLHPDRAPTIVAGMILLEEALAVLGFTAFEVSEHDILHGGALRLAGVG